jgi:hypothetical protein
LVATFLWSLRAMGVMGPSARRLLAKMGGVTLLAIAAAFWAAHGHPLKPCTYVVATELPAKTLGITDYGGCQIDVNRWLVPARNRYAARLLCVVVVHEAGHTVGLRHRRRGIMAPNVRRVYVPRACRHLHPPITLAEIPAKERITTIDWGPPD